MLALLPPTAWVCAFLLLPMLVLVPLAFADHGPYGEIVWRWNLRNAERLFGFGDGAWSASYLLIFLRTVWLAVVTTALCVAVAYPVAFFIASRSPRAKYIWLTLMVLPLCTNLVIRSYAWLLICSADLPPARFAQWLGLIEPGWPLAPSAFAVTIGMVTSNLPFAVLPIYTNVERLDWSLVEAAQDLYAGRTRTFVHGVLRPTMPGLVAAAILTFIPAMGAFVVPALLGGGKVWYVGNLIQEQFGTLRNWPFGAMVSLVLIVLTLAALFLLRRKSAGEVTP